MKFCYFAKEGTTMAFTTQELDYLGEVALDYYLKNQPIDQVSQDRPLLQFFMQNRRSFPGGKQYVVEQLRYRYQSNFQWVKGDVQVTYNRRQTIKQSNFPWSGVFDGFTLNEDELFADGINISPNGQGGQASEAEQIALTNILEENVADLRLGFEEKFDYELHRDGTQATDALVGLDALVALDPTTGTVGGLDRSVYTWWQNQYSTAISTATQGTLIEALEVLFRNCSRHGGKPTKLIAGEDFIDALRKDAKGDITRYIQVGQSGGTGLDPSVPDLSFHRIPIQWDPTAADLDTDLAPATPFKKRCYFLQGKLIRMRPGQGHDMISRRPPVVYDRPTTHYWGLSWKGAITLSRANAQGVAAIA